MKPNIFCIIGVVVIINMDVLGREYLSDPLPTYKGGYENLARTIKQHLKYPVCCIAGNVYISFVVEADGRLTNKKVVKGVSSTKGCNADEEALKVLDYLTEWQPAEQGGKKIAIRMILPIKFSL
jgi:hypothetical protein